MKVLSSADLLKLVVDEGWQSHLATAIVRASVLDNIPAGLSVDIYLGLAAGLIYARQRAVGVSASDVVIFESQIAGVVIRLDEVLKPKS